MRRTIDIISDGTGYGTRVYDETGAPIKGIIQLDATFSMDKVNATLTFAEGGFSAAFYNVKPKLIRMARWSMRFPFYLVAEVHPADFGSFYQAGYRSIR